MGNQLIVTKSAFVETIQNLEAKGFSASGRNVCPLPEGTHTVKTTGKVNVVDYVKNGENKYLTLIKVSHNGKEFDVLGDKKTCHQFLEVQSDIVITVNKDKQALFVDKAEVSTPAAVSNENPF